MSSEFNKIERPRATFQSRRSEGVSLQTSLRVAAISYLNTVPLMYDFTHGPQAKKLGRRFDLHFTLPAECAEELRAGRADIGIIPVAAYADIPGLLVIPGVAIAAKHPVRSILLVSKLPLDQVRSVAADNSSRTSVALMKVLFARRWRLQPEFVAEDPDLEAMLNRHDAALLIGDPALRVSVESTRYRCFDLAEEWQAMTGLPFVFAFWAVRGEVADAARELGAVEAFQHSRDAGLAALNQLAEETASQHGVSTETAQKYLSFHIDFDLDADNFQGLQLFFRYAAEIGALGVAPDVKFL